MPLILGVTGTIASGKSSLCRYLAERYGAVHADADAVVHGLYAPGTLGFGRVVAEFGSDIVGPDGAVDRKILGARVFGRPERMEALRRAIGDLPPVFFGLIDSWRRDLGPGGVAILEAINLISGGYAARCDANWIVVTTPETARRRLMERNRLSAEDARARIDHQGDWSDRLAVCDRVFHNDAGLAAFLAEIDAVFAEARRAYREGTLPPPHAAVPAG